jgi:hypothetical protein
VLEHRVDEMAVVQAGKTAIFAQLLKLLRRCGRRIDLESTIA